MRRQALPGSLQRMATRRPFRTEAEGVKTPKSAEERAGQSIPKVVRQAGHEGNYLPTPGSNTTEDAGHGHSPQIPWPADKPVEHKPFKVKE